jgi:hypothetical protein
MDLYNYLLRQRIIFLSGYVNDKVSCTDLELYYSCSCTHCACGAAQQLTTCCADSVALITDMLMWLLPAAYACAAGNTGCWQPAGFGGAG